MVKMFTSHTSKKAASLLVTCCLLTLSQFLFLTSEAHAQGTGKVIVTFQGSGSPGIAVELSGRELEASLEKKTGKSASVTFGQLTTGSYVVTPRKGGIIFTPQSASVTVTSGKTTRLKIKTKVMPNKVGTTYCVNCHAKYSTDIYADWLKGPHGNFNYVNQAHQKFDYADFTDSMSYPGDYTLFTGFPNDASITASLLEPEYAGMKVGDCLRCHGPNKNDNSKVATFPLVRPDGTLDEVNSTQIARPMIGCESCHGGGTKHIASPGRSLPFNNPTAVQCGQCHSSKAPDGHLQYHPMIKAGDNNPGIYEAYQSSPHVNSINDSVYANAKKTSVQPLCSKCHTDQGARIYRDKNGDATALPALFTGEANHTEFSPVQCRTCHDAHNPEALLKLATAATGSATARSTEFNTCTNCHQLLDSNDAKITPYHTDHDASITKTHYDDPATVAIEGYNINQGSDTSCSNCHNPHVAITEINKQWAESGHGDKEGAPWDEQDFKTGSAACKRCHTTTGFIKRLENPDAWDAASGNVPTDFSYLKDKQKEMLYCNACHTNSAFDRRTISPVKFPSTLSVDLHDDSNLCMACHQGRASKSTVDAKAPNAFGAYAFTNIHYFAAAASFFGTDTKGGYEYAGKTYVGQNMFTAHEGKRDTCVKCHFREGQPEFPDHHMKPEVSDCSSCHTGITDFGDIRPANTPDYDGDGDTTEGLKGEIDGLKAKLYTEIRSYAQRVIVGMAVPTICRTANSGAGSTTTCAGWYISYDAVGASGQYFFKDPNNNGVRDTTPTAETTAYSKFDLKLSKAAYNYQVSMKEPCGHIHNAKYIGQLLYDSIKDLGGDAAVSTLARPEE